MRVGRNSPDVLREHETLVRDGLGQVQARDLAERAVDNAVPASGQDRGQRVQVAGGFSKPGQVAVQQPLPLPLQVLAFVPEVDTGDDPEMRGNR